MNKKAVAVFFITLIVLAMSCGVAFADNNPSDDLSEKVNDYAAKGGETIKNEVDALATNIIDFVRGIAGVVGVIFVIWAGFVIWGAGGDPRKIEFAKRMIGGFIVCMILVFAAEKIVGGLFGLLGYGG